MCSRFSRSATKLKFWKTSKFLPLHFVAQCNHQTIWIHNLDFIRANRDNKLILKRVVRNRKQLINFKNAIQNMVDFQILGLNSDPGKVRLSLIQVGFSAEF